MLVGGGIFNVGRNFGRPNKCPICLIEDDSQEHLITCCSLTNDDITLQEYRSLYGSEIRITSTT